MDLYVSNLSPDITNEQLRRHFTQFGTVSSVHIAIDKETNRSRGFGYINIPDSMAAEKAIREMNGTTIDGRAIKVSVAKPREERSPRSSFCNRW